MSQRICGFAPGNYTCRCGDCQAEFAGDKRAIQCLPCAMRAQRLADMQAQRDGAYSERNKLVALLAAACPSGIKRTEIPGWDAEWHGCVYVDLPTGQASWHYHDREAQLFAHLPPYAGEWDGHTTEQKYERIAELIKLKPALLFQG